MTVAELIEKLKELNPERKVVLWDETYGWETPALSPIIEDGREMVWIR